jgi:hypothetical protein
MPKASPHSRKADKQTSAPTKGVWVAEPPLRGERSEAAQTTKAAGSRFL